MQGLGFIKKLQRFIIQTPFLCRIRRHFSDSIVALQSRSTCIYLICEIESNWFTLSFRTENDCTLQLNKVKHGLPLIAWKLGLHYFNAKQIYWWVNAKYLVNTVLITGTGFKVGLFIAQDFFYRPSSSSSSSASWSAIALPKTTDSRPVRSIRITGKRAVLRFQ